MTDKIGQFAHGGDSRWLAELMDGTQSPTAGPSDGRDAVRERPGSRIGRYKLLQQIGEGGFGVVFMAEQQEPVVRKVALKIIKLGMDTRQVVARFEAERQALAMMDHPNIAKVHDAGTTESGRPYFVMELVQGIPITQYCDQKQLTPKERLELFIPVCQAVQHAHQKGIIHRDLKPSNVLVMTYDGKPVPKVIDFGVAKALHQKLTEKTLFTQFGNVVGTLEYMSPEQTELDVLGTDTRSDIYSLGVLLYELLTGSTPLDGRKLREAGYAQMLKTIREEEPPKPSTRVASSGAALAALSTSRHTEPNKLSRLMAGDLDWIVMRCLEKDRSRRYETADGLARDIGRYLSDEPVEASPPSATYKLRKFARKYRIPLRVAAGFILLLAGATVVSSWQAIRATRAKATAVAAEQRASRERDQAQFEKKRAEEEKNRADEQAAIAKAINNFLNDDVLGQADMSNQVDPSITGAPVESVPDPDLTVHEALNRAIVRIPAKFKDQPLVEAAIRTTIATLDGPYEAKATPQLEQALRLRRQFAAAGDPDTLRTMCALAEAYYIQNHIPQALTLLEEAVSSARKFHGEGDEITFEAGQSLLYIYADQNRLDEAESLLTKMLDGDRRLNGGRNAPELNGMLGVLYMRQGRLTEAEPLLLQRVQSSREQYGKLHNATLRSIRRVAELYRRQGQYWKSEVLLAQALAQSRMMHYYLPMFGAEAELRMVYDEHQRHPEAGPIFLGGMDGFYNLQISLASAQLWVLRHTVPTASTQKHILQLLRQRAEDEQRGHRFREGLADLLAARQLDPNNWELLLEIASLQLYLRDERDCLFSCQEAERLPHQAGWTMGWFEFERLMLTAPAPPDSLPSLNSPNDDNPLDSLTRGILAYRHGHFDAAARLLSRSWGVGVTASRPEDFRVVTGCLLAMAEHRRGNDAVAAKELETALKQMRAMEVPVHARMGYAFSRPGPDLGWYLSHVAAREAEELINPNAPSTVPTPTTQPH